MAVQAGDVDLGGHLLIREGLSLVLKAGGIDSRSEPERVTALLLAIPRNIFSWNFGVHEAHKDRSQTLLSFGPSFLWFSLRRRTSCIWHGDR
jgi:hypothetical protein